jgi:hypothetical protein
MSTSRVGNYAKLLKSNVMDICRRFYIFLHYYRSQKEGVQEFRRKKEGVQEEEGRRKKNSFHQSPIPNPQSPVSNYKLMGNTL